MAMDEVRPERKVGQDATGEAMMQPAQGFLVAVAQARQAMDADGAIHLIPGRGTAPGLRRPEPGQKARDPGGGGLDHKVDPKPGQGLGLGLVENG